MRQGYARSVLYHTRTVFGGLFLATIIVSGAMAQDNTSPGRPLPSPEQFVNAIYGDVVGFKVDHYFLVAGSDSCWFTKFDYEEWSKYGLLEPVPFLVLNQLSEKVYESGMAPYYWKKDSLQKAICVTRHQADSIIKSDLRRRPAADSVHSTVFSFSYPRYSDDGEYAVIDTNFICGIVCGEGFTCIFRRQPDGRWKLVGRHTNWSS